MKHCFWRVNFWTKWTNKQTNLSIRFSVKLQSEPHLGRVDEWRMPRPSPPIHGDTPSTLNSFIYILWGCCRRGGVGGQEKSEQSFTLGCYSKHTHCLVKREMEGWEYELCEKRKRNMDFWLTKRDGDGKYELRDRDREREREREIWIIEWQIEM